MPGMFIGYRKTLSFGSLDSSCIASFISASTITSIDKYLCIIIVTYFSLIGHYILVKNASGTHHFRIVRAIKCFNVVKVLIIFGLI